MWQNPYSQTYNPLAGVRQPTKLTGQLNIGQFQSPGVITPPTNANPFLAQSDIPATTPPAILPGQSPDMLQPQFTQQMGQMVVSAFENFKKSVIDSKENGDNMILTVKIPTQILKQDPNFSFLFK